MDIRIVNGELRELTDEEKEGYKTAYNYTTTSEFKYECRDKEICVPIGFLTDGSSGGPDYGSSWLFHDYLYACHKFTTGQDCSRMEADQLMV